MVSESIAQSIADVEFDLQERLFSEFGSAEPAIKGYRIEEGKIASVHRVSFEFDFRTQSQQIVQRMLAKYPIVVTVAEVFIDDGRAERGASRSEGVALVIYTAEKMWVMLNPIERSGKARVVKGELVVPVGISGALVDGPLTAEVVKHVLGDGGGPPLSKSYGLH